MHKQDIRALAQWKAVNLEAMIFNGVKSLTRIQTLSEMRGIRPSETAYETIGRKLTSMQRAMERMNRIAKGLPPFGYTENFSQGEPRCRTSNGSNG